ncbi:VOC family protein [Bacteriovorax sp. PP10]|uniref:VOC family protein n=1 Tax=Bacteriovorax antarcticus TaxID=3088717 RepID=A0ABU5VWI0_9BACT|nr:VOC family protein [Bacteriovorax sp. PP10]MEA9357412.1 VOC family protein [Bacteriovorax sp. PP10]
MNTTEQSSEVRAIPKGFHAVTPYIIVDEPAKALEFYEKALGAKVIYKMEISPGEIAHAEFKVGDSIIMMAGNSPEMHLTPQRGEYRSVSFMVYVPDVDAAAEKALGAGMKLIKEVRDQFYGDRAGTFEDPFGHIWTLGTHIEDVDPEELRRRAEKVYN